MKEIVFQQDVPARMRDGTVLYANVYRPAGGGRYPVLLTRLPYGKDLPRDATYFDPIKAASRGYIVVVQDVRGRFRSEGEFSPYSQEFEDGYDTVQWAASLPGSDGRVGMWGLSYYGKTQWHAAVMQPPALRSLAPGITWGNHLNGAQIRGGVQELGIIYYWAEAAIAPDLLFRRYGRDRERLAEKLPELLGTIDAILAGGGYDVLPTLELPDPDGLVGFVLGGLKRGVDDGVYEHFNIDGKYGRIGAPSFHIGGWYDCFIGETLRQYEAMKRRSAEAGLHPPRLLVGPWTHADFSSTQGELDFGMASSGAFVNARGDLTDRQLRWFDATLKGEEAALEDDPPVEVFVMGENRWRSYDGWPVPGSRREEWHLHPGGRLSRQAPPPSEPDAYDYDPKDPVPTRGGATLLAPIHPSGPVDQRPIEERPDVLVYTSDPLPEDYTLLGPVWATLHAASSAPDTDFVVRLTDVHPDGRSIVITDGIIRASARESYPAPGVISPRSPSPIEPGRVYEYCVDLWATGITLRAGHRLRVEVTSSSHPRWERNLNTGESAAVSSRSEVARQRIFHDPQRPSRVTLTVAGR